MFDFPKQNLGESVVWRCTFRRTGVLLKRTKSIKMHIHKDAKVASVYMIYICTWQWAATFCRHHEILTSLFIFCKARGKTSRSYLCGEFRFSESPVQIQNWTIIYHGTEHFVSHHFSSLETTHYAFSSSAFAQLQRHIFTRWCVEPSSKHIHTAEILNKPPRASKWKF